MLTGSVSRGVADEFSDIEMLIVTPEPLDLTACFEHARAAGLEELDTWGAQDTPMQRVSGFREGVPLELIWWSRDYAESSVDAILLGDTSSAADAIANGRALRTSGSLSRWQVRLRDYPDNLAAARIEEAALTWGGFAPAGLLTLARPGEQLARVERMLDDASRVLRIVYALNRVWQPTHKRLDTRRVTRSEACSTGGANRRGLLRVRPTARIAGYDRAAIGDRHSRAGWPERKPGALVASGGCEPAVLRRRVGQLRECLEVVP